jgi:hypothetical protein
MTKFTIEIDHELSGKITFENLKDSRQRFLDDLGMNKGVFAWNDPDGDNAEIQRHIDAIDVILGWYGTPDQLEEIYGE